MIANMSNQRVDPLHAYLAGGFIAGTKQAIPLIATQFHVTLLAGVAIVSTIRRFRNAEDTSIEATITFPVPVHAALFDLTAAIGERRLKARAQRRDAAREHYENAVDAGHTAILHEEVLRGVHMLSVAHIPPGCEIEVQSTWITTLANIGGRACLRIPLTVGDIYGRTPLADSDDLIHAPSTTTALLTVDCQEGETLLLNGAPFVGREMTVALNRPIDLAVLGWQVRSLHGLGADGRHITLKVEGVPNEDAPVEVAIVADRSGSMAEPLSGEYRRLTKHYALLRGLRALARAAMAHDFFDLWQFNDGLDHAGSSLDCRDQDVEDHAKPDSEQALLSLVNRLGRPEGGTEIGEALEEVMAQSHARDILLITDGKSYAIDVHELARAGRRITVVLLGEDSLEANVGHLAALTGGEIFIASGHNLIAVLKAALQSLRVAFVAPEASRDGREHITTRRSGMQIAVSWQGARDDNEATLERRAIGAIAASLALPLLTEEAATDLAEREGLVTHLTSLVLVDEAGAVQQTLPAARKVALPMPATALYSLGVAADLRQRAKAGSMRASMRSKLRKAPALRPDRAPIAIDWELESRRLAAGDLTQLPANAADSIRRTAAKPVVIALACSLKLDPIMLLIGLLAHAASKHNRSALRVARAIFNGEPSEDALAIGRKLRLV
jgi:hypothetical protein